MAKEWFTLAELRGLNLPEVDAAYLRAMARHYAEMSSNHARARGVGTVLFPVAEFHISILPERARDEVQRRNVPIEEDFIERARKLGICLPVRDPRGVYVGPDAEPEISQLERMLELHRTHGAR